jgi:hypothetical protein
LTAPATSIAESEAKKPIGNMKGDWFGLKDASKVGMSENRE